MFYNGNLNKHNICWNWLLLQNIKGTCFQQMLNISVNFDACFMKKLWDLAHEKLVNIQGGHHVGTNIHGWQPYLKIAIYVLKSANGGLLCRPLYLHTRTLLHIFTFQNHKTENLFMYWYETVVNLEKERKSNEILQKNLCIKSYYFIFCYKISKINIQQVLELCSES